MSEGHRRRRLELTPPADEKLVPMTLRLRRFLYDRARGIAKSKGHESLAAWVRTLVIAALEK